MESVRHDIKLILQMAITKMLDEALPVSGADRLEILTEKKAIQEEKMRKI